MCHVKRRFGLKTKLISSKTIASEAGSGQRTLEPVRLRVWFRSVQLESQVLKFVTKLRVLR